MTGEATRLLPEVLHALQVGHALSLPQHTPATMQVRLDNWHNTKRFTTPCVKVQTFTNIKNPTSIFILSTKKTSQTQGRQRPKKEQPYQPTAQVFIL